MIQLNPVWTQGCVLTIGNFDGVHLGHRSLIESLVRMGRSENLPSVVFSFDPPPLKLLRPDLAPTPLTWNQRREELLRSLGVDLVYFYPTSHDLLEYSPSEFFQKILVDTMRVRGMVEGPNFRFGKGRSGDIHTLKQLCQERGVTLEVAEPKSIENRLVSSTQIRDWMIPKHGVYAARVVTPCDLVRRPVALHIGPNPTFGEDATKVEAHLLDFHGDLYSVRLELEILDQVRGVKKFGSKEELLLQLHRDIASVRSIAVAQ